MGVYPGGHLTPEAKRFQSEAQAGNTRTQDQPVLTSKRIEEVRRIMRGV